MSSRLPVTYEVVRSAASWEALAPEWIELWCESPGAKPFQRPEWLLPWWRQFGQADLRVVVARQANRLLALLPFYVYPEPETGERQVLLAGAGTSDYLDGIFSPRCTAAHLGPTLELLREESGWDRAFFAQLLPGSLLLSACEMLPASSAQRYPGESCGRRLAVPMRALPPKLRAEVLYRRNAANGLGKLTLETADKRTWEPMFEQLVRFHTARWQEAGESGVLADPRVLAHHRDALPRLLASGMLRLCALRAGSHTLAVLYSLVDLPGSGERTQYFYLMGYAPEHRELRPGTLLLAYAMEQAVEEGVVWIDMLRGEETYKKFWRLDRISTVSIALDPKRETVRPFPI